MKHTIENVDDRVGNENKLIARVESVTLIQFFMRNKYIDVYTVFHSKFMIENQEESYKSFSKHSK